MPDRPKRILCVGYHFPPRLNVGANRLYQLARRLRSAGWAVRVLTAQPRRASATTWAADAVIDLTDLEVVRVRTLNPPVPDLVQRGHGVLATAVDSALPFHFTATWAPAAIVAGLRALRRQPADLVFATSPPPTGAVVGYALSRLTGTPLVLEMRDPWFDNVLGRRPAHRGPLRPLHDRLDRWMERRCVEQASLLVTTGSGMADRVAAAHRLDPRDVLVVRNGWRADELTVPPDPPNPVGPKPVVRWLYPGAISALYTPQPVLDALSRLVANGKLARDAVRVRLLTDNPGWVTRWLAGHAHMAEVVSGEPLRPRPELMAAYAEADVLILCHPQDPVTHAPLNYVVPAKAYEYLATGKPILVVGAGDELRDVLEPAGTARFVEDVRDGTLDRVVLELSERLMSGDLPARPAWSYIAEYSLDRQLDRAIGGMEAVAQMGVRGRADAY